MKPIELKSLLFRIAQKDEEAFKKVFDYYYPRMIQVALTFVPGVIAAQEVVSDVFYKILKNPATLAKVEKGDQYFYLAVKNQCCTYLKKNKYHTILNSIGKIEDYLLPDLKNPEKSLINDELFALVETIIQNLPPKRKTVFLLVKEEGKKYQDVADILDISVKTVELQMSQALKALRKGVREYLDAHDVKIKPISSTKALNSFF